MTEMKDEHLEIISKNKGLAYQLNIMRSQISSTKEAISYLENGIKSGFLFEKHSLIIEKWLVQYKLLLEELDTHLTEMSTSWMKKE